MGAFQGDVHTLWDLRNLSCCLSAEEYALWEYLLEETMAIPGDLQGAETGVAPIGLSQREKPGIWTETRAT